MLTTWILVADAQHAQLWSRDKKGALEMLRTIAPTDQHKFRRDINSDKPGRSFSSAGAGRSSVEPHQDPMTTEREHFARELIDHLAQGATEHAFGKLILIAPPKMLGMLREHLPPALAEKMIAGVPKNLIKSPTEDIRAHILGLMP
jgi:protein required for attachment to host cells